VGVTELAEKHLLRFVKELRAVYRADDRNRTPGHFEK